MKSKLEHINMKKVIIIGGIVILVITLLFILFRTNILFNNRGDDDEKDPETIERICITVSAEAKARTKPESALNKAERKHIIVENFEEWLEEQLNDETFARRVTTVRFNVADFLGYTEEVELTLSSGDIRVRLNDDDEFEIDPSRIETQNGPESGCPIESEPKPEPTPEPIEDPYGHWRFGIHPENISIEAWRRTKPQDQLTPEEKMFILMHNAELDFLPRTPRQNEICNGNICVIDSIFLTGYSGTPGAGRFILHCSGEVVAIWNEKYERWHFDPSHLACGD